MGMSTHIIAYLEHNEAWRRMTAVYEACRVANIPPPKECLEFFKGQDPYGMGPTMDLENKEQFVKKVKEEFKDGFVVDVKKLLELFPGVTHIKFYNSY